MKCAYPRINADRVEYPCGQCINCRINKRRKWVLRNFLELHDHLTASFVTLTYDPEHLPERALIDKKHVQLFFKKVRREFGPVRYFGCGEYGSKNQRPHYHFIIYGIPPYLRGTASFKRLNDCWWDNKTKSPRGSIDVGDVTMESIQYVAGYTLKAGQPVDWCYAVPPRSFMSRRPGIGKDGFLRLAAGIDNADYAIKTDGPHVLRVKDRLLPVDRYFKKLFFDNSQYFSSAHQEKWEPTLVQCAEQELLQHFATERERIERRIVERSPLERRVTHGTPKI